MAEHKHGTMDTTAQQATYASFIRWVFGIGAFSIGVLIFLAIFNS